MTTRTVIAADGTVTTRALTAGEIAELAAVAPTAEQKLTVWRDKAEISSFQAKEQLRVLGLLTAAEAIAQGAGGRAWRAWLDAGVFRRRSGTINQLVPALRPDLTGDALEEWKDQFFRDAMLIEA